jgi:hypothetical protein
MSRKKKTKNKVHLPPRQLSVPKNSPPIPLRLKYDAAQTTLHQIDKLVTLYF